MLASDELITSAGLLPAANTTVPVGPPINGDEAVDIEADSVEPAPARDGGRGGLRGRAVSGALWNYGSFTYLKLLTLISTIVMARHLSVAEFGLASLALIIIGYLDTINDFGIGSSVIREDDDDDVTMSVAFWLTQLTGVIAFVAAVGLAPITSRLFHQPRLALIQIVLGLVFLLGSLSDVHDALIRRRLMWRRRMPADFLRTTIKGAVAIGLAIAGFGAWSLVWSQIAAALVFCVAIVIVLPWRPKFVWDKRIAKRQASFGGQVMLTTVFATLLKDADFVLVGIYLTTADLGIYTLGFRLPDLAIMGVTWSLSATMFPVFSRVSSDRAALARAVVKVQRMLSVVLVPIGIVLGVGATQVIQLFYGSAWHQTARVTPFIAAYSVMYGFAFVGGDAFKSIGRVDVINKIALARLPATVLVLWIAVQHGIIAVAAAQLGLMTANFVVQVAAGRKLLGVTLGNVARAMGPALLGGAALAAVMVLVQQLGWSDFPTLVVGGGIGLIAYIAIVFTLERDLIRDVTGTLRKRGGTSRSRAQLA